MKQSDGRFKIGIICGKLGDVDGVSLEVEKWISVLTELGNEIFTFAGSSPAPVPMVPIHRQFILPKLRFDSPEQKKYESRVFPFLQHTPLYLSPEEKQVILNDMEQEGRSLAGEIYYAVQENRIDVLIAQNTNAMPMTLIGGTAVHILAVEKRIAVIFHHHDFWWERSRFSHNFIEGLLGKIMPPTDPGLEHVVLSSYAQHILRSIKRVHPRVIPNCENFDNPVEFDDYNRTFRQELGFKPDDILILQPTRIVRRKRIEDSLELAGRFISKYPDLAQRTHFIISLYQGDEPDKTYVDEIKVLADSFHLPLHLIAHRVSAERGTDSKGLKLFTNRDVMINANLVTYLPIWEGFGNALLEALAARVPVAVTTYLVYKTDIKIMGFDNIEIRDVYDKSGKLVIPERAVDEIHYILTHPKEREQMVQRNFRIGKKEFGMRTLRRLLRELLDDYGDEIRASRKRIEKGKRSYPV